MNSELHSILTDNVLEEGVSRMILDNLTDMNEIRLEDNIHIRQEDNNRFVIYQNDKRYNFETRRHYNNKVMLDNVNEFIDFCKEFIGLFENCSNFNQENYRRFIFDIILSMVKECFKKNNDSIINFMEEEEIHIYIKQGIFDNVENLYFEALLDDKIRNMLREFEFDEDEICNFEFNDDNEMEELDIEDYNRFREQDNNYTFREPVEYNETLRFEDYLKAMRPDIYKRLEMESIEAYFKGVIFYYNIDFKNFVRRIKHLPPIEEYEELA